MFMFMIHRQFFNDRLLTTGINTPSYDRNINSSNISSLRIFSPLMEAIFHNKLTEAQCSKPLQYPLTASVLGFMIDNIAN